ELADDEVVLVVAGDREHRVRALAPCLDLVLALVSRRVDHDRPELLLDPERPPAIALDDHDLVPGLEQGLRQVVADLATARDDEVHQRLTSGSCAESSSSCFIAAFMRFGPIVLSPESTP